jgi:hypothetical protein
MKLKQIFSIHLEGKLVDFSQDTKLTAARILNEIGDRRFINAKIIYEGVRLNKEKKTLQKKGVEFGLNQRDQTRVKNIQFRLDQIFNLLGFDEKDRSVFYVLS